MIERDHRIKRLSEDLAEREEELRVLRGDEGDAEVLAMPRHAAKADWDALPSVEDLWSEGNFPTVVDLPALTLPAASQEMRKHA